MKSNTYLRRKFHNYFTRGLAWVRKTVEAFVFNCFLGTEEKNINFAQDFQDISHRESNHWAELWKLGEISKGKDGAKPFSEEGNNWSRKNSLVVPGTPIMDRQMRKDESE